MFDWTEVEAAYNPKTREADIGMPQVKLATEISQIGKLHVPWEIVHKSIKQYKQNSKPSQNKTNQNSVNNGERQLW